MLRENDCTFTALYKPDDGGCIYTGNNTVKLADNSTLSLSNSVYGPCQNNLLDFITHKNTLLIHPNHDRAYMRIRCKGNKEVKQVIYKDELVALPLKCMTWVAETKKKDPDIEKDFIGVEEEYINSEDGSKIEGNINMTRNAIIFLPFKTLSDLDGKEKKTEEYLSFMKTILADEYEEQKQGSKFTYIIIGMAVMLVLAATCVTLRKIKGRANSMSYSAYAQREQQKKELEEKQEEIRELLVRRYRDSAEEDGSHRRRSSDGWDTKEPEDMYENDNQDFDEDKKQEGKSRHDEESLYEHYEVPRILFGLQIHEYHDDIVLIKPETEKNGKLIEDEKMGSKEEAKKRG